jgi:hypothetical protein
MTAVPARVLTDLFDVSDRRLRQLAQAKVIISAGAASMTLRRR